jgi:hypothetical protein
MTVSSTTTKNSYSGNGSTTTFAYGFKIFANTDLTVILRSALGAETVQTLTTHYTVSNVGVDGGGNVVFVAAPASGVTVVIRRNMALTQSTDYVANDPFPAATHEDALDRLTFISQQIQEEVNRSIKLSRTNTMTSTEFTTSAADRANKILAFDTSGELAVTQELGTYKGTDTTTTTAAYTVRDIIKSTTAGQLNNVYICIANSVIGDTLTDTDHFELLVDAYSAASSAAAAASSATDAQTAQTAAELAETNAETAETNAETAETNAAASEANAAASEANAATSESNAATSESNASTSESNASTSASTATTQAGIATTQAGNASTSASNAATSESNAATSESNAATSESNAATSASNAATSESNAATSETNAAASAAAAAASADTFDDTYLGSKSSDPSVDNDGDALNAGDLYFNTTSNTLKVYTGSAWQDAAIDSSGFVQTTGDTMTGALVLNSNLSANGGAVFNEGSADVDFRVESNGNANMLFVDGGNDRVGVGGTPTAYPLEIYGANGDGLVFKETTNSVTNWFGGFNSAGTVGTLTNHPLTLVTNATERMRITSAGNVGIGTSSPTFAAGGGLQVKGSDFTATRVTGGSSTGVDFAQASDGTAYAYNRDNMPLIFGTNNAERMRIDSSGSLLAGTTADPTTGGFHRSIVSFKQLNDSSLTSGIQLEANGNTNVLAIGYNGSTFQIGTTYRTTGGYVPISFSTGGAERMRIDSNGKLGINRGEPYNAMIDLTNVYPTTGIRTNSNTATAHWAMEFHNSNGQVGTIELAGTSTLYNTSSDHRLKENVVTEWDATTRLKQLKPSRFNFIADASTTVDGFLAHEVQEIVPEAISGTKDGLEVWREGEELPDGVSVGDNKLDDDGNTIPKYQGIDQSKLVPLLVKTIQELEARITALEGA